MQDFIQYIYSAFERIADFSDQQKIILLGLICGLFNSYLSLSLIKNFSDAFYMNLVMLWRRKLLLVKFIEFILIMIVPASPKQVVVGEASLFY